VDGLGKQEANTQVQKAALNSSSSAAHLAEATIDGRSSRLPSTRMARPGQEQHHCPPRQQQDEGALVGQGNVQRLGDDCS
jgi:hypothetical protein